MIEFQTKSHFSCTCHYCSRHCFPISHAKSNPSDTVRRPDYCYGNGWMNAHIPFRVAIFFDFSFSTNLQEREERTEEEERVTEKSPSVNSNSRKMVSFFLLRFGLAVPTQVEIDLQIFQSDSILYFLGTQQLTHHHDYKWIHLSTPLLLVLRIPCEWWSIQQQWQQQ